MEEALTESPIAKSFRFAYGVIATITAAYGVWNLIQLAWASGVTTSANRVAAWLETLFDQLGSDAWRLANLAMSAIGTHTLGEPPAHLGVVAFPYLMIGLAMLAYRWTIDERKDKFDVDESGITKRALKRVQKVRAWRTAVFILFWPIAPILAPMLVAFDLLLVRLSGHTISTDGRQFRTLVSVVWRYERHMLFSWTANIVVVLFAAIMVGIFNAAAQG